MGPRRILTVVRRLVPLAVVGGAVAATMAATQAPAASNLVCSGGNLIPGILATCPAGGVKNVTIAHAGGLPYTGVAHAIASCPAGDVATGGGATYEIGGSGRPVDYTSEPVTGDTAGTPVGWHGSVASSDASSSISLNVYAVCVPAG